MRDILFDEKIAGSFHFTPGQAYEEVGNGMPPELDVAVDPVRHLAGIARRDRARVAIAADRLRAHLVERAVRGRAISTRRSGPSINGNNASAGSRGGRWSRTCFSE